MALPENRTPTHPGHILLNEFLVPLGITQERLAKHLGISEQRIRYIVLGLRSITPTAAWQLAQAFGTTPEFWMNLQTTYDLARSRPEKQIERLLPNL